MDSITNILHIGHHAEFELIASLLSDVHHRDYRLTGGPKSEAQLELILSNNFDVIMLDYHWQENGSARDLLIAAISQGCDIPIIVMTDEMEADVDREAIQLGASDYLIKGRIDSQLLERTIRYAIERKVAESKLAKLAHYDALTGIPNRILFRDRIDHAIQFASRDKHTFTLMYLDLDGFKQVNDSHGHDVGDELIRSCAERIVSSVRRSDSVARMGGDEFTVLIEQPASSGDIAHIAEKIISSLEAPHKINGIDIFIGCSIGIAVYPEAGSDITSLLRNADKAMYQAKSIPASTYQFFTEAMNVEASQLLLIERELNAALETQKIQLYYSTIINCRSNEVDALMFDAEWYHPSKGWLPYRDYENLSISQISVGMSSWLASQLELLVREAKKHGVSLPPLIFRVNQQALNSRNFIEQLKVLIQQAKNVCSVELCLKEPALVAQYDRSLLHFHLLESIGCRVVLEDVGEHLSSLDVLFDKVVTRFTLKSSALECKKKRLIAELAAVDNKQLIWDDLRAARTVSVHRGNTAYVHEARSRVECLISELSSREVLLLQ